MSSCQTSPHMPTDSSGFQKATMPKLQITSNDEEANIWAKMAECKWHKALREEAAQLEAERLERNVQVHCSKELHSDVADLELESLQSDCEGVGVELDEGIMHQPKDVHMKGWWSDSGSGEEKELQASNGEVFKGDSE
ncbi:hypothetical protein M404DRAFT_21083 [Pisolithus tinctorius Marx 270]|uniref:Uncharacterized protein n=1 Tax=Pisolithus tinctorius Marx 270 TaxID=870435 RepID=A0A0C3KMS9_PISTI|nr:hypothetical protein M404DRAFT_21083 [Pisolithus tinctorius Marx 270]